MTTSQDFDTTFETRRRGGGTLNANFVVLAGALTLLCVLGLIMVASASSVESAQTYGSSWTMLQRQVLGMVLGGLAAAYLSRKSMKWIRIFSWPLMLISVALLAYTLRFGVEVGGQKNWIRLPFNLQFQPSELAKLALVLFCAHMIANNITHVHTVRRTTFSIAFASSIIIGLVLLERDLGTPIILAGIALSILFASGLPGKTIGWVLAIGVMGVAALSLIPGKGYRIERFLAWLNPAEDPQGYGYQILHGQFALASGGIFGNGLGQSVEKWGALPAAHTDFILSIIGEELGLFGTLVVLFLLMVIVYTGFRIAEHAPDDFGRMVAFGVSTWIAVQVMVNVGAIVRFLPITGVPLPFVSYGGSSLAPTIGAMGLLLAIARNTGPRVEASVVSETEDDY